MKIICLLLLAMLAVGCGTYHAPKTIQITTLAPASGTAGGPQFTLTVNGSGFASGSVVYFNTAAEATTLVSGTQLTVTIPAAAVTTTGAKPVYVLTSGSGYGTGGQTSNTVNFMVN